MEISGVLNLQKAEEHPNHATLCGCVLSCTDADKEHDSVNCKQGGLSPEDKEWRGGGKREYRGYRKIMWQKRGEEKVEKCGNTHELQASHGEQGRETKIQIWRNTRRKKRVKTQHRAIWHEHNSVYVYVK